MKVSIIIPCYNVESYVGRCLTSIQKQTIGINEIEVILVDDASTDNTLGILRGFEESYSQNTILVSCEKNLGAATARNIGLTYATGQYIAFIDADDYIDETMLEKMVDSIELHKCDMVECSFEIFRDNTEIIPSSNEKALFFDLTDVEKRKEYIVKYGIRSAVWGRLYSRDYIERNELRFLDGAVYEDVHFSGLSFFLMKSVYYMPEKLYFYYENEAGIMHTITKDRVKQEVYIVRRFLEEMDARGMLDRVLELFYAELEYYCILKSYIDPIGILSDEGEIENEDIIFYRSSLLDIFPKAGQNAYAVIRTIESEYWKTLLKALV